MGQAKRRGSFEQRKDEAVARHIKERELREEQLRLRELMMTPEEKAARHKARMKMATLYGVLAGGWGAFNNTFDMFGPPKLKDMSHTQLEELRKLERESHLK